MTRQLTREQYTKKLGITPEADAREAADVRASSKFLSDNWEALKTQYGERWIGISSGSVVGDADTLQALLALTDARGVRRGTLVIEYMGTDDETLILPCH